MPSDLCLGPWPDQGTGPYDLLKHKPYQRHGITRGLFLPDLHLAGGKLARKAIGTARDTTRDIDQPWFRIMAAPSIA